MRSGSRRDEDALSLQLSSHVRMAEINSSNVLKKQVWKTIVRQMTGVISESTIE